MSNVCISTVCESTGLVSSVIPFLLRQTKRKSPYPLNGFLVDWKLFHMGKFVAFESLQQLDTSFKYKEFLLSIEMTSV